ncbi:MAG: glutamate--tRNA ligase [SAR202 cluster bacterium]|nr:glutamate--tRNA ligase [SAR202 cluster bacterium]
MADHVRVRFAPSPTGEPHVGNIRTAIFDWLMARGAGGAFIIRIEDTDQARKVEGTVEAIYGAMKWLGLDWDEGPDVGGAYGPYVQSERLPMYREVADRLVAKRKAYRCTCSPERLEQVRKDQMERKQPPMYDRRCRSLSAADREAESAKGGPQVVRFAMPMEGVSTVNDLIRGEVSFENRLVDDFVMLKSDGFPTYHLANVVDDRHMKITHVLRAEEWLPSTPRHLQLYAALGWEPPRFAHLPIILAPDRSKLSKRHGATSVMEYRALGYLPQALLNFLTLLGWSLDDKTEILSPQELIRQFSLERVTKSAAIFNIEKLNWMNGVYIRGLPAEGLADALLDFWSAYPPEELPRVPQRDLLLKIVPLIQERLKTLKEAAGMIPFFMADPAPYGKDELIQKKTDDATTKQALERSLAALAPLGAFDAATLEGALRPLADQLGIKAGQLLGTLRVATTGLQVAPPLFQTMEVLGKDRVLRDIRRAMAKLEG